MAIGLAVNALILARGVILMLALDYADLGFVALVQAGITFTGMLHFGLLNGGYRLLCHAGPRTHQRLVDLAYTAFAAITAILALIACTASAMMSDPVVRQIAFFTIIGGMATLMRAWTMNEMAARQRLGAANAINAASATASLCMLGLLALEAPYISPALIALSAIVAQPALFVALALGSGAVLRPRGWCVPGRLSQLVLASGAIMFVAGLAQQLIPLIERAYVSRTLGLEALGHLYLAFLFVTLFQMAPNLIQQAFLAPVIERWRARDGAAVRRELRALLAAIVSYCAAAALALWLLAEPLVTLILPHYVADLRWVYAVAPGLILFTLAVPFSLGFNVVIDYRWYLIAGALGVGLTLAGFAAATLSGSALTLDQIAGLRSGVFAAMGAALVFGSYRLAARAPEFRLFGAPAHLA